MESLLPEALALMYRSVHTDSYATQLRDNTRDVKLTAVREDLREDFIGTRRAQISLEWELPKSEKKPGQ